MRTRTFVVVLVLAAVVGFFIGAAFKRAIEAPVVEECTITLDLNDLPPQAAPLLPGELYDAVRI